MASTPHSTNSTACHRETRGRHMRRMSEDRQCDEIAEAFRRAGYGIDTTSLQRGHAGNGVWPLLTTEGAPVLAKVFEPEKGGAAFVNMQRLWRSSFGQKRASPGLPQPLEYLKEIGAVIMQRCDGRSLSQAGGLTDERIVQTIGLLASLHECDAQPETRRSSRGIIRSIRRKAEQMEKLLPQPGDCVSKAADAM